MRRPGDLRHRTLALLLGTAAVLLAVLLAGALLEGRAMETALGAQNLPPSLLHPFGTDWLGRDMLARTLAGLSLSIRIGALTTAVSALLATAIGLAAATLGRWVDAALGWLTDLMLGIPHVLLMLLLSLACGRGFWGVVAAVSLSHWPSLARLLRAEALQLGQAAYVRTAARLGVSRLGLARRHYLPHLAGQLLTGLVLQFPHAILHEAGVTFLGFGLSSEQPAIGVILSESMRYLTTGRWWLALFPGLALAALAALFAVLGERLRRLFAPSSAHE